MFAVVKVGGRQYRVSPGDEFVVEKLNLEPGSAVQLPVLLWSDESGVTIGQPLVTGQSVEARILGDIKGTKLDVFRYQSKKRYRKKTGHRQTYTRIKILGEKPQAAPEPAVAASAQPEAPADASADTPAA